MSKKILCSRGAYYESSSTPSLKGGMYELFPPLLSPVTPVIITSANVVEKDIATPNSYLNNDKLFHSYGQAWGEVTIEGEVLLGSVEFAEEGIASGVLNSTANGLRVVELYFALLRSSVYQRPIILSSLRYAKPINFFLTKYTRGRMNAEFNIVPFSMSGFAISKSASGIVDALTNEASGALSGVISGGVSSVSQSISGALPL